MTYKVILTADALRDLEELDDYISETDSPAKADYVLDKLEEVFLSLADLPDRGKCPKELAHLGIREFREVYFRPYRIVYAVREKRVYIYLVADGRRDMQTLLSRRLLRV